MIVGRIAALPGSEAPHSGAAGTTHGHEADPKGENSAAKAEAQGEGDGEEDAATALCRFPATTRTAWATATATTRTAWATTTEVAGLHMLI